MSSIDSSMTDLAPSGIELQRPATYEHLGSRQVDSFKLAPKVAPTPRSCRHARRLPSSVHRELRFVGQLSRHDSISGFAGPTVYVRVSLMRVRV